MKGFFRCVKTPSRRYVESLVDVIAAVKLVSGFLQKQKLTKQHTQSNLSRANCDDLKSQPLCFYPKFQLTARRSLVVDLDALDPRSKEAAETAFCEVSRRRPCVSKAGLQILVSLRLSRHCSF